MSDDNKTDKYEQAIIKIVTENWRLLALTIKIISKLDVSESNRYMNQIRYFNKVINDNLETVDFKIVDLIGNPYDAGMAVTALNIDDFEASDKLYIDQIFEPLIMKNGKIKKQAVVSLRKVEK